MQKKGDTDRQIKRDRQNDGKMQNREGNTRSINEKKKKKKKPRGKQTQSILKRDKLGE